MKLVIRPEAECDAAKYWHYIAQQNWTAANRFLDALERSYEEIRRQPAIGHQESFRRQKGIRSWRVKGFPKYLIFYRVEPMSVDILRVIHGMRNLPRFFA
jgi:toxin ParE1/3/4